MGAPVIFVADAGESAGLGHISRSGAIASALRSKGVPAACFSYGADTPIERDGLVWTPLSALPTQELHAASVLVADSYTLPLAHFESLPPKVQVVLLNELGAQPSGAALVVNTTRPAGCSAGRLEGLVYAALRPPFWGVPRREVADSVRHVLVTTGGGDLSGLSVSLAELAMNALPDASIELVRGPYAAFSAPAGVEVLDAPESLLQALLRSDIVLCAAGQTTLEAAAVGTPALAIVLAENQVQNAALLARSGIALTAAAGDEATIVATLRRLASSEPLRRELSSRGQAEVDGYGAFRIAFEIARLADTSAG